MSSGWVEVKLGEVLDVLTDYHANGSYKKLKENVELLDAPDYAIMIRTTNFERNSFKPEDFKYINKSAYEFLEKSKVYPGDIIMNKIANAGSVYLMPDLKQPVSLGMNLFLIRTNKDITNQRFVYYYLKANESYIKKFATGTTTSTITKDAVRNLVIKLPSKKIQDEVVNILKSIEDKIELNRQMNETLEEMAMTLYKYWFIDFGPFQDGEFVESELGMIPKGWEVYSLKEIFNLERGISYKGKYLSETGIPMINLKCIGLNGGFKRTGLKYYIGEYKEKHKVSPSNIIVANTDLTQSGDVIGSPAIVPNLGYEAMIISSDLFVVNFNNDFEDAKYAIYLLMKSRDYKEHVKSWANGSTVLHLSKDTIMQYKVTLPPVEILNKFNDIVSKYFDLMEKNENNNTQLTNIREYLLPRLLSGKIEIKEVKEQVQEVLNNA